MIAEYPRLKLSNFLVHEFRPIPPIKSPAPRTSPPNTLPAHHLLLLQPRQRRNSIRIARHLEGGLNGGRKMRAVVDGDSVEQAALRLGGVPDVGGRAAVRPEARRPSHARRQHAEVLAAAQPHRRRVVRPAEVRPERALHPRRRRPVVHQERVARRRRDLGRGGCAGCRALGVDDALQRPQHARARVRRDGAHVELEVGAGGDDVLGVAGVDGADGDDDGVGGVGLARDDGLQAHDGVGGQHDGVDGAVRLRPVAAAPVQRHVEGIGGGGHKPALRPDVACPERHDVPAQHHVRHGDFEVEPVVDHGARARAPLFRRLEAEYQCPCPVVSCLDQKFGGCE